MRRALMVIFWVDLNLRLAMNCTLFVFGIHMCQLSYHPSIHYCYFTTMRKVLKNIAAKVGEESSHPACQMFLLMYYSKYYFNLIKMNDFLKLNKI